MATKSPVCSFRLGQDEQKSTEMLNLLESEPARELFPADSFTMIKIVHGTPEFAQFNAIYPIMILPTVYFIGGKLYTGFHWYFSYYIILCR